MIHVRDAARDRIEHLKGADELSRSKDLNFEATAGDRRDRAAKPFSAGAKTGKAFRPAGYQLELPGALGDGGSRKCGRYASDGAGLSQKAASIHGTFPLVFFVFLGDRRVYLRIADRMPRAVSAFHTNRY